MVNARRRFRRTITTGKVSQSGEQIIPGLAVDFLVVVENVAKEVARHSTTFDDNGSLKTSLYGSELEADCVVIHLTEIIGDESLPYPYTFGAVEGPPATLGDILRSGTYAWDREMFRPRRASQRPVEREPQHDSTAELGNVKENIHVIGSSDEEVAEVKRPKRTRMKLLNEESDALLKMRFADKVHCTVSLIKILECAHSISASELDFEQVAQWLQSSNVVSDAEKKQYVWYADLALKLVNTPGMVERVIQTGSSRVLVRYGIHTPSCGERSQELWNYAWVIFEDVRTFFFGRALAIYRAAPTVGAEKKLILEDFFKKACRIYGDSSPLIPVSEFVFGQAVCQSKDPSSSSCSRRIDPAKRQYASKTKPGSRSAQPPSSRTTKNKEKADDDDGFVVDLGGDAGPPGVRRMLKVAAKWSTNSGPGKRGLQKWVKAKGGALHPL
ncbi:hypothetical protein FGB62_106g03 [Gracilaria domingensis]|nr:hypothetical protein FGB62_106g03 [Gracilaria domingensis]